MSNPKKQMRKQKLEFDKETGLRVYKGEELHFNDYLRQQVGAGWYMIRNILYGAGYGVEEVFEYRELLLKDFRMLCRRRKYIPVIYK